MDGRVARIDGQGQHFRSFHHAAGCLRPHARESGLPFRETFNENHIRGYGLRGRRVLDFGWAIAARGWGKGGTSQMRLQMHATDPATLEPLLGRVESKGCIRIPASLNVFLDRHGILDADCEEEVAGGKPLWVLGHERGPIARPGRYLVIVDSMSAERPAWSPLPLTE